MATVFETIQIRRGTTAQWVANNIVLNAGELGADTSLGIMKLGDGVTQWSALPTIGAGASGPSISNLGYDIVIIAGQSNASGRGTSYDLVHYDPIDDRVDMYAGFGTYANNITKAYEPMASANPDGPFMSSTPGMGPGLPFARWYSMVTGRRVLLVPTAYGGTGFEGADTSGGTRRWKVGDATASTNLYEQAITITTAALAASEMLCPGQNQIVGVLWHQGENDNSNGTSQATYQTDIDALIAGLRSRLSSPNMWFLLGQMNPAGIGGAATLAANGINKASIDTPRRNTLCAFTYAPALAGQDPVNGSQHYSAAQQRLLGKGYFDALALAKANVLGVAPNQVQSVLFTPLTTTTGTVSWVPSPGRVTGYLVETTVNGGTTWSTVTRSATDVSLTQAVTFTAGQTLQARVSKINEQGTGTPVSSGATVPSYAPNAPTALTVPVMTGSTAAWSWTAPTVDGTHNAAATYLVERSVDGGTTYSVGATVGTTSVTLTGLAGSTAYTFRVTAINAASMAGGSATATGTTDVATAPTFPTTSLDFHLDAAYFNGTTDGAAVGAWVDSVAAKSLSATGAPTFKASAINGLPAVVYNGTTQKHESTAVPIPASCTEVIVARLVVTSTVTACTILGDTNNATKHQVISNAASPSMFAAQASGGITSTVAADTSYHIFLTTSDGVLADPFIFRVDSVQASLALSALTARTGVRLGASASGTYAQVEVAEVLLYSFQLGASDLAQLQSYLSTKYGLAA